MGPAANLGWGSHLTGRCARPLRSSVIVQLVRLVVLGLDTAQRKRRHVLAVQLAARRPATAALDWGAVRRLVRQLHRLHSVFVVVVAVPRLRDGNCTLLSGRVCGMATSICSVGGTGRVVRLRVLVVTTVVVTAMLLVATAIIPVPSI